MGKGELTLIAALVLILFFGRELPRLGERLKDQPESIRSFWLRVFLGLGALFCLAVYYGIKNGR